MALIFSRRSARGGVTGLIESVAVNNLTKKGDFFYSLGGQRTGFL